VAIYSHGVGVTWGGSAFSEIVGLDWTYGGGAPKGRSVVWTDEAGSVSVTTLAGANTSTAEYGLRKQLVISGGGQSLTVQAVWESLSVANEVNGVTRYTVTFKILDG
jgi:hypothetical protein